MATSILAAVGSRKRGFLFDTKLLYMFLAARKTARAPKEGGTPSISYLYEQEALSCRVKFYRITRRWYPDGWKYFLQLVLEGNAPIKLAPQTGEPLHPMGQGRVGHDIGTQTVASCGDKDAKLLELAPQAQDIQKELRRVNRAMDRSRRAVNPEFFNEDGTVIRKNRLPAHCLAKSGRRAWKDSKRYKELAAYRRYLYGKQAMVRTQCHNEMAN